MSVYELLKLLEEVNPFLVTLTVNPIIRVLFFYIFPIGFSLLFGGLVIHEMFLMSKPARTFRKAKLKKDIAIIAAVDDTGILSFKLGKADMGEGSLNVGNPGDLVFFLPNQIRNLTEYKPTYLRDGDGELVVDQKGRHVIKNIPIVNESVLRYNELLKHRTIVEDISKPIYFGSVNSSIAAPPSLMDAAESALENAKNQDEEFKTTPRYPFRLWNIDTLKSLVNLSITPESLQRYGERWKMFGELGMPKSGLKKFMVPFLIFAVIAGVVILLAMSGGDLSKIFGGIMPPPATG